MRGRHCADRHGSEVAALRRRVDHRELCRGEDAGVWLVNSNIPEFSHGNRFNHEPKRPRKLLLKLREIAKLHGAVARQGMTLVPLSVYFNSTRHRRRSSSRSPRAAMRRTSARTSRNATGRRSRAACSRNAVDAEAPFHQGHAQGDAQPREPGE